MPAGGLLGQLDRLYGVAEPAFTGRIATIETHAFWGGADST